jgi:hypothetical protein
VRGRWDGGLSALRTAARWGSRSARRRARRPGRRSCRGVSRRWCGEPRAAGWTVEPGREASQRPEVAADLLQGVHVEASDDPTRPGDPQVRRYGCGRSIGDPARGRHPLQCDQRGEPGRPNDEDMACSGRLVSPFPRRRGATRVRRSAGTRVARAGRQPACGRGVRRSSGQPASGPAHRDDGYSRRESARPTAHEGER